MISYQVDYKRYLLLYLIVLTVVTVLSGFNDHIAKWAIQSFWIFGGVPILVLTFKRFPLTHITYFLILIHMCILLAGAHYTYQKVPIGIWFSDWLDLSRTYFDRVGHFAQGFVPAMIIREVLIRRSCLQPSKWLFFLVVCVCMSISAMYEYMEWALAVSFPKLADAAANKALFLAEQGDVWDTHWDMLMALIGAICAQSFLAKLQDNQLNRLLTP